MGCAGGGAGTGHGTPPLVIPGRTSCPEASYSSLAARAYATIQRGSGWDHRLESFPTNAGNRSSGGEKGTSVLLPLRPPNYEARVLIARSRLRS